MELATPNAQRSMPNVQLSGRVISNPTMFGKLWFVEKSTQVENCARTSTGTRAGRPVLVLIGHHRVRAFDNSWPSLLHRISVNRSNVSRVALPTHVRNAIWSPSAAGAL